MYAIFNDQSFNDTSTNDIVSFEQLGPGPENLTLCLFPAFRMCSLLSMVIPVKI